MPLSVFSGGHSAIQCLQGEKIKRVLLLKQPEGEVFMHECFHLHIFLHFTGKFI